jgi:SAM-dependent methyltransferase
MTQVDNYRHHYLNIITTYPSAFALKCFMGNNPYLKLDRSNLKEKTIIDIGFGDGRDLSFFKALGMQVSGVEPDNTVVEHTLKKLDHLKLNLRCGTNMETGFSHGFFDYVYACSSIYYLPSDKHTIRDALKEANKILKENGVLFSTFARSDSHVTKNATVIDKNTLILEDPFYGFRKGQRYHVFNNIDEIKTDLKLCGFDPLFVGNYDVDWFGTRETLFLCYAKKSTSKL